MSQFILPIAARANIVECEPWATPLQPLTPVQRVGYLRHLTVIQCIKPLPGFEPGQEYPVATKNLFVTWQSIRTNVEGGDDHMELTATDLAVFITGNDGPMGFIDQKYLHDGVIIADTTPVKHNLTELVTHFAMPDVPDIARVEPAQYVVNLDRVNQLQLAIRQRHPSFAFKTYQREDCARAAIVDGSIVAHDTGLGKALSLLTTPLIKYGWTITGRAVCPRIPVLIITIGDLQLQMHRECAKWFGHQVRYLGCVKDATECVAWQRPGFYVTSYNTLARPEMLEVLKKFTVVMIDEGTKFKSDDALVAHAVRQLNPKFRMVATATPIKNRLPDIFWLAWFVAGGKEKSHPRWIYDGTAESRALFAKHYTVVARNITKESQAFALGKRRHCLRQTAEACNVPNLWMRTAPLILRRRKVEVADEIVKKIERPVFVPFGTQQRDIYLHYLRQRYLDKNGRPAIGRKMMRLRQVAAAPTSMDAVRSTTDYTPKMATTLQLISAALARGEQVIVFNAFQATTDAIAQRLRMTATRFIILDGRTTQSVRATMADQFKAGEEQVMLAGAKALAYGHSFPAVNNVISTSMDWAMDESVIQSPDRAWRLDSLKDLNFNPVIVRGSVEERIFRFAKEKSGSAELVLDGDESSEIVNELNIADILKFADTDFDASSSIDEQQLEAEWQSLKINFGQPQQKAA